MHGSQWAVANVVHLSSQACVVSTVTCFIRKAGRLDRASIVKLAQQHTVWAESFLGCFGGNSPSPRLIDQAMLRSQKASNTGASPTRQTGHPGSGAQGGEPFKEESEFGGVGKVVVYAFLRIKAYMLRE